MRELRGYCKSGIEDGTMTTVAGKVFFNVWRCQYHLLTNSLIINEDLYLIKNTVNYDITVFFLNEYYKVKMVLTGIFIA